MAERERVKESWDKIGRRYHASRDVHKIDAELERIVTMLPASAAVLDAGSGAGVPVAKYLASAGLEVTGIDISEDMLDLARTNVPGARFLMQDITGLDFPAATFDGVICLFTLWHVSRTSHAAIFHGFNQVLKPGGLLVINTGARESDGWSNFFGQPMLWSNHEPRTTLELVKNAGFSIISEGNLARGGELQYWIFAKKNIMHQALIKSKTL